MKDNIVIALLILLFGFLIYNTFFSGSDKSEYIEQMKEKNEQFIGDLDSMMQRMLSYKDTLFIYEKTIEKLKDNYYGMAIQLEDIKSISALRDTIINQLRKLGAANFE